MTRLFAAHSAVTRLLLALVFAAALCAPLRAQSPHAVTILMLDGKTGKPIIPSNFIFRTDHLNTIHNDWIAINDEGVGRVNIPAGATDLSLQGTYNNSMDIYVNCDAAMQKNVHTLHWYSVADILAKGVNAPNECYKGKFAEPTRLDTKPGVFVFYVRKNNWNEIPED